MKKLTLFLTLLIPVLTYGQIINIPNDYPTIQQGIDAASKGDTVLVDTGTYVENINFKGKNITVASHYITTFDNSYILNTIIDGEQPVHPDSGSVVMFISGEDSTAMLSGFTIKKGSGLWMIDQTHGGGIFIKNSSSPKLKNLIVSDNVAESSNGAGIFCIDNCNSLIENVIISNNDGTGDAGTNDGSGGISIYGSSPTLTNVLITQNEGLLAGGMFVSGGSPTLINVTIADNKAYPSNWNNDTAEIISWYGSHPVLINTVVWNDSLKKIIVRDNEITISYSNIQGGVTEIENDGVIHWLEGNIDQDPLFVNLGDHPYQVNDYSPCIDAGTPETTGLNLPEYDLAGEIRIFNDRIDMGAYEWNPMVDVEESSMPEKDFLHVILYPNPFKTSTTIEYALNSPQTITITFYNQFGKEVDKIKQNQSAGKQQVVWGS
jgi:hypothetical protein